ncbi:DUF6507 family protein [Streptomyces sp. NPDC092952]|uniref:DUF6507 family protein n=1 Tax=Streptomyces sp. NPDC092952 TaxID=3366018 RepID=UPI0038201BC1
MTGWDIKPSGVESVLSLVGLAGEDLSKSVKGYGENVEDAAPQLTRNLGLASNLQAIQKALGLHNGVRQ